MVRKPRTVTRNRQPYLPLPRGSDTFIGLRRIAMKLIAVALATIVAALALQAQDKPASGTPARVGVLNIRDCMDKTRNNWIAEIEADVAKVQEAESGRATDLNP